LIWASYVTLSPGSSHAPIRRSRTTMQVGVGHATLRCWSLSRAGSAVRHRCWVAAAVPGSRTRMGAVGVPCPVLL
jgi:hypothetical protein